VTIEQGKRKPSHIDFPICYFAAFEAEAEAAQQLRESHEGGDNLAQGGQVGNNDLVAGVGRRVKELATQGAVVAGALHHELNGNGVPGGRRHDLSQGVPGRQRQMVGPRLGKQVAEPQSAQRSKRQSRCW
jgi:hypothetical protein